MSDRTRRFFNQWRFAVWAAGTELFFLVPLAFYHPDTQFWFLFLFVLPAILLLSVILIGLFIRSFFRSGGHRPLPILVSFVILWAIPASLELYERAHPFELYELGKWHTGSSRFKAELLATARSGDGTLRHVAWDGSGFAGIESEAYLVFDPSDGLSANTGVRPGKPKGIPCEVYSVRRLEAQWYSVVFFTNTDWDYCGESNSH